MRQVNPNKTFAGEYIPQYYAFYARNNAWNFQWHNKHSQIFETSHDTNIINKFIMKIISNMTCQSLCHSLNKLPFASLYTWNFFFLPTPTILFETTLIDNKKKYQRDTKT